MTDPFWVWRFSAQGTLQFERCRDATQWQNLRAAQWSPIKQQRVSKRLLQLATVHRQPNLYLVYLDRHPRREVAIEPEAFQILLRGLGSALSCSPDVLRDLSRAFFLPTSFFLLPRLSTVPRPFDGETRRRWDRMSSIRPTYNGEVTPDTADPARRIVWTHHDLGEEVIGTQLDEQDGRPFLHLYRTPRLYVVSYLLEGRTRQLVTVAASMDQCRATVAAIHPDGLITSVVSEPAVPGLVFDQELFTGTDADASTPSEPGS